MLVPMSQSSSEPARQSCFVTTHWSVVAAAGAGDSAQARAALEKLCSTYWYPLYAFVRRLGHNAHDAEDVVQSFFTACLENNYLAAADEEKGRFRSFLLLMLKRFMAKEWRRASAQKRGGGCAAIELDALTAEQRYAIEPSDRLTAEQIYERRWALTLLQKVFDRLRGEQSTAGRGAVFDALKDMLVADGRGAPYAGLAARLGMTEGAIKVAVHRLRDRYRALLEEEIANTLALPLGGAATKASVEEERRHLLSILARPVQ